MAKYIYHDNSLRCKVNYLKNFDHFHLQLQKRFLFIWLNVGMWMTVSEGDWEKDSKPLPNIMYDSYQMGHECETYARNTLDIPKRVTEFFKEYLDKLAYTKEKEQLFNSL